MSGHRKTDSTCDETALLRGQSHSRESSGASNLSVKFTVAPDAADTAAIVETGAAGVPTRGGVVKLEGGVPAVSIVAPGSPPGSDNRKASRSLASAVSHRKKRQKLRKSGKQQHGADVNSDGVADDDDGGGDCSDPEEVDAVVSAAASSRLQNGSCDSTDTPTYNNNEG